MLGIIGDREWILAVLLLGQCERLLRDGYLTAIGRDDLFHAKDSESFCKSAGENRDGPMLARNLLNIPSVRHDETSTPLL